MQLKHAWWWGTSIALLAVAFATPARAGDEIVTSGDEAEIKVVKEEAVPQTTHSTSESGAFELVGGRGTKIQIELAHPRMRTLMLRRALAPAEVAVAKADDAKKAKKSPLRTVFRWLAGKHKGDAVASDPLEAWFDGDGVPLQDLRNAFVEDGWSADSLKAWVKKAHGARRGMMMMGMGHGSMRGQDQGCSKGKGQGQCGGKGKGQGQCGSKGMGQCGSKGKGQCASKGKGQCASKGKGQCCGGMGMREGRGHGRQGRGMRRHGRRGGHHGRMRGMGMRGMGMQGPGMWGPGARGRRMGGMRRQAPAATSSARTIVLINDGGEWQRIELPGRGGMPGMGMGMQGRGMQGRGMRRGRMMRGPMGMQRRGMMRRSGRGGGHAAMGSQGSACCGECGGARGNRPGARRSTRASMARVFENLPPEIRAMAVEFLANNLGSMNFGAQAQEEDGERSTEPGNDDSIQTQMVRVLDNLPPEMRAMAEAFLKRNPGVMKFGSGSGDADEGDEEEDGDAASDDATELLRSMPWVLLQDATGSGSKCDTCPSKGSCGGKNKSKSEGKSAGGATEEECGSCK